MRRVGLARGVRYRVVRFPSVGSTNDIALDAATLGVPPGLVVQADVQVRGKGRKARDWVSPEGGLWATVLLAPGVPLLHAGLVPLAVGCACVEALGKHGAEARLRWPNDLMLDDAKLGGILVETRSSQEGFEAIAAGIGINVANPPPVAHGTSLAQALEHAPSPRELLATLLSRLPRYEEALGKGDAQWLCERFMHVAWGMGRTLLLDGEPVRPKEIAVDGALIVEREGSGIDVVRSGSLRTPGEP